MRSLAFLCVFNLFSMEQPELTLAKKWDFIQYAKLRFRKKIDMPTDVRLKYDRFYEEIYQQISDIPLKPAPSK